MVKYFEEAITTSCRRVLQSLGNQAFIDNYYLAGGTALALQIGHRLSTDLDWFSASQLLQEPARDQIRRVLDAELEFEVVSEQDGMLFTRIFETDVSFIYQHHPLLDPMADYQGVKLASPVDIGLMKLAAINSRGTRRDFIDVYCLRSIVTLKRLLELAPQKYHDRPNFLAVAVRALVYFNDAEQQPMPEMLVPVEWEDVRSYCEASIRSFARKKANLDD